MNITNLNKTLDLVLKFFDNKKPTSPIISFCPGKPVFYSNENSSHRLPRCMPEEENIPSQHIRNFLNELNDDPTLDMHNVLIMRHGRVLSETSFGLQDSKIWKTTFSACKSITSLAIGMLVDEGKLDINEKIRKIFEAYMPPLAFVTLKDLTVKHLLTMTSGIVFNEAECMTSQEWIKSFLNSMVVGEIGKTFNYNSLNTYMLSAIVKTVSGQSLTDFLEERLFSPLGIRDIYWEKSPEGIEKGGWGLFIRPEDIAKIGQLVLQRGIWNGKRIVSEEWIDEATQAHAEPPKTYGAYNYGYQIWVGRYNNSFLFNGMLGQNVLGFKDSGILLVTNAGNEELFQQSNYFKIANKYFSEPFSTPLENNFEEYRKLELTEHSMSYYEPNVKRTFKEIFHKKKSDLPVECSAVSGRIWKTEYDENAFGLFPVMMQAINNNYSKGLSSISFKIEDDKFYLLFAEKDDIHVVPIGFDLPERATVDINGDPYEIATIGSFAHDEDDNLVIKINIAFMETPCTRKIRIYFRKEDILYKSIETPGAKLIIDNIIRLKHSAQSNKMFGHLLARLDDDYISYKVCSIFEPKLILK